MPNHLRTFLPGSLPGALLAHQVPVLHRIAGMNKLNNLDPDTSFLMRLIGPKSVEIAVRPDFDIL